MDRKRILVVADLFYSYPRIPRLVGRLQDAGWEVVVVSRPRPEVDCSGAEVLSVSLRSITTSADGRPYARQATGGGQGARTFTRRSTALLGWLRAVAKTVLAFPDDRIIAVPEVLRVAESAFEEKSFDVLLSSGPPQSLHIAANLLSRRWGIPWIADARDLWAQNHNYAYFTWRRPLDACLEMKTLSRAAAVVVASPGWQSPDFVSVDGSKIKAIPTGCPTPPKDGTALENTKPRQTRTSPLTLVNTGPIYRGLHNFPLLLESLDLANLGHASANSERLAARFVSWGRFDQADGIAKAADRSDVELCGVGSALEAARSQMEADWLVAFTWNGRSGTQQLPLRFIEYLVARKPILVFTTTRNSLLARIVSRQGIGVIVDSVGSFQQALDASVYNTCQQKIESAEHSKFLQQFSVEHFGDEYIRLLHQVAEVT